MKIVIASNNGEIGGGEIMLLNIARALRSLGHQLVVLGPAYPGELLEAASDEGFTVITLPARDRKTYMAQLRLWRKSNRDVFLWCNGLVPSMATAGDRNRLVHLHQLPVGIQKYAFRIAKRGARFVLVPSQYIARLINGALVFENWVSEVPSKLGSVPNDKATRIGFLGRPALIKGTHTLAQAIKLLNSTTKTGRKYELLIGGEAKFVDTTSQEKVNHSLAELEGQVQLLGWVEPDVLFRQIDILVVPSEVEEAFGLVAAEAMSARCPLIVSDAGALPETVGEGYPWVFRQGDIGQLAAMIDDLAGEMAEMPLKVENTLNEIYWRWLERYSPESGRARVADVIRRIEE